MKTELSLACCLPAPCRGVCLLPPPGTHALHVMKRAQFGMLEPGYAALPKSITAAAPQPPLQSHLEQFTKHAS